MAIVGLHHDNTCRLCIYIYIYIYVYMCVLHMYMIHVSTCDMCQSFFILFHRVSSFFLHVSSFSYFIIFPSCLIMFHHFHVSSCVPSCFIIWRHLSSFLCFSWSIKSAKINQQHTCTIYIYIYIYLSIYRYIYIYIDIIYYIYMYYTHISHINHRSPLLAQQEHHCLDDLLRRAQASQRHRLLPKKSCCEMKMLERIGKSMGKHTFSPYILHTALSFIFSDLLGKL